TSQLSILSCCCSISTNTYTLSLHDALPILDLTEDMLLKMCQEVMGTTTLAYQDSVYDFGKPFTRLSVFDAVLQYNPQITREQLSTLERARQAARDLNIQIKETDGLGKIHIEIFEETVEHKLDQPTFITEYPIEVSPLARRNDENPAVTDRFEFFIGGRELANGFSELNDAE